MNDASSINKPLNSVEIEGFVDRIVYQNPDNDYIVIAIKEDSKRQEQIAFGKMVGITPGEHLKISGRWKNSQKYGKQIEVINFQIKVPANVIGLEKYLGSGMIKGIGKHYAKAIVRRFGLDTLTVLNEKPEKLREVDGIGEKRLGLIKEAWDKHRSISEIMIALQSYGISTAWAARIYKHYREASVNILRNNPYQIAIDISGIGFKTADKIARQLGIPLDSIERAEAGLLHLLFELSEEGNVYFPFDLLIEQAEKMLEVKKDKIVEALKSLNAKEKIKLERLGEDIKAVYTNSLWQCEKRASDNLLGIISHPKLFPKFDYDKEIADYETVNGIELADEQRQALKMVFEGQVSVITGGPGTGKTTLVRAIIKILSKHNLRISLASPTGRAAKRLSETTGMPAATIHRLLKYQPENGKFFYGESNKLKTDLLIIDETSMLDIVIAHNLLKAIEPSSSIVFVGDIDQLPSVGPGNFLKDLISSGKIAVTRLEKIFRQAARSLIVKNAHKINSGEFPYLISDQSSDMNQDFYFVEKENPEDVLAALKDLVCERIPRKFSYNPIHHIQVISPMYKGILGVNNLNSELQEILNPDDNYLVKGSMSLRVGDKVIQNKNNYDKDVFNGDIGIIRAINREDHSVRISFFDKTIEYEYDDLDEISLAYAVSVHKSQGSEYPAIVMPIHTQHFIMLQRNLLYTAITRGKKLVCLVGTKKALAIAIKNDAVKERHSGLSIRLMKGNNDKEDLFR